MGAAPPLPVQLLGWVSTISIGQAGVAMRSKRAETIFTTLVMETCTEELPKLGAAASWGLISSRDRCTLPETFPVTSAVRAGASGQTEQLDGWSRIPIERPLPFADIECSGRRSKGCVR